MRYYVLILILFPFALSAQLTSPGARSVRYANYQVSQDNTDPLFFYCNKAGSERASVTALRPGGEGNYDYTWHKWDEVSNSFSILIKTEAGVPSSTSNNLDGGGYRVSISKSGLFDTALIGWVFYDSPPVAGAVLLDQKCFRVALDGTAEAVIKEFGYEDPANGVASVIKNETTFLWSASPSSFIPLPNVYIDPVIENNPVEPPFTDYRLPLENTTYRLQVSTLGCSSEASFLYESIHVKADATFEPDDGEAPLEVFITDKSVRGAKYKWDFGDGTSSDLKDPGSHIYYRPGTYYPTLAIESEMLCVDSVRLDSIRVEPSALSIPNVFTPDGDGTNDRFVVESKSLRSIVVEIFTRSGVMIYSFRGEGEALAEWTGWDGRVNNSSGVAVPGVYFYIIRARGWDDIVYDGVEYRGFLHLYR